MPKFCIRFSRRKITLQIATKLPLNFCTYLIQPGFGEHPGSSSRKQHREPWEALREALEHLRAGVSQRPCFGSAALWASAGSRLRVPWEPRATSRQSPRCRCWPRPFP